MKTTKLATLLLDLDGTLVDSLPLLKRSLNAFLQQYGYNSSELLFEHLNGFSLEKIVLFLKTRYPNLPEPQHMLTHFQNTWQEQYLSIPLHNGAKSFLEHALDANLNLVLVSAAPYQLADQVLKTHKIDSFFHTIQTNDLLKKEKQHPSFYETVLEKLKLQADETLLIEDSLHNIFAASQTGIKSILIAHRSFPHPFPFHNNFDSITKTLELIT